MRATLDLISCPLTVNIRNKNPREIRVESAKFGSDPFSDWHISCMLGDLMNKTYSTKMEASPLGIALALRTAIT